MRAMILAAGLGTRLRPLTHVMPKPMAPVLNRPVMEHTVRLCAGHGFDRLVANLSHLPEQIRDHFGDGSELGVSLSYSEERRLLGTAGGVREAADFLTEEGGPFLVISGDALTDVDLTGLRAAHEAGDGIATMLTKRVPDTSQLGVVITGSDGRVQGFQEKPHPAEALSDLANCGIYMFSAEIFDYFPPEGERSAAAGPDDPPGFADWAQDVFPTLLDNDVPFHAHETSAYWNDIGSIDEFLQGNFDALAGEVELVSAAPRVADGVWAGEGSDLDGVKVRAPVLLGADCAVGAGTEIQGPVAVGDGARIGAGAMLREAVILPGADVPETALVIGGVYGVPGDRPLG